MFLLKKIIAAFVLPPGCLVLALGGLAVYLRRRCRPAALACAALGALTWLGSTKAFSDALLLPLEGAYAVPAKPEGDVIILLGGGARPGKHFSAAEGLAPASLERAAAAAELHRRTGLPVLASAGKPFSEVSEASLAAAYLAEAGVPEKSILTEERSRDTFENAAFTLEICKAKGFSRPILVTSAYHMPRAMLLFREAGFETITPLPVGRRQPGGLAPAFNDLFPGNNSETGRALNEYLGLLYYRAYYSFRPGKKGKI